MTIESKPSHSVPDNEFVYKYTFHDDDTSSRFAEEERYRALVKREQEGYLSIGTKVLKKSGAVDILAQLVEALKQNHPDAGYGSKQEFGIERGEEVSFNSQEDGMLVETMALWDYKEDGMSRSEGSWESITVGLRVLTEEIVIAGQDLRVIPPSAWSGRNGKQILEDSICNAAVEPIRTSLHSTQIG